MFDFDFFFLWLAVTPPVSQSVTLVALTLQNAVLKSSEMYMQCIVYIKAILGAGRRNMFQLRCGDGSKPCSNDSNDTLRHYHVETYPCQCLDVSITMYASLVSELSTGKRGALHGLGHCMRHFTSSFSLPPSEIRCESHLGMDQHISH